MLKSTALILTCEHASNHIPHSLAKYFRGAKRVLTSHEGYDIGAKQIYTKLTQQLSCQHIQGACSRLVVDLNRSLTHRSLFSRFTQSLSPELKQRILARYYYPYHQQFNTLLRRALKRRSVVHLSIHSFTPVMHGITRTTDIGILYDAKSSAEKSFAHALCQSIRQTEPKLIVRKNYPYRGSSVGLTTITRRSLSVSDKYIGIELEINQKHLLKRTELLKMQQVIRQSLQTLMMH